ncbi:hypothetical protein Tco_0428398, partial [Tanacetum coccineum]
SLVGNGGVGVGRVRGVTCSVVVVGVFGSVVGVCGSVVVVFGSVCSVVGCEGKNGMVFGSAIMGVVEGMDDGCDGEKGNSVSSKSTCLLVIVLCLVLAGNIPKNGQESVLEILTLLLPKDVCVFFQPWHFAEVYWDMMFGGGFHGIVDEIAEDVRGDERKYRPSQRLP